MNHDAGIDVSLEESSVCAIDGNQAPAGDCPIDVPTRLLMTTPGVGVIVDGQVAGERRGAVKEQHGVVDHLEPPAAAAENFFCARP